MTSSTPPLILVRGALFEFTMLRTSLYPAHSCFSVSSPLIITGQALTMTSTSSGGGLYWRPTR